MKNCQVIDHPVVQAKLSEIRNKETSPHSFRKIVGEISALIAYEATRDLKLTFKEIETPLMKASVPFLDEPLTLVTILRAGMGMTEGVLEVLPYARVGHIGIYRDKFINNTVEYYFKLPKESESGRTLLCDPMIATGDTILASCERLKQYNISKISILSLLVSKEALNKLSKLHPDITVYTACIEESLNEKGYLLPGLGDCGDRLYGTL